MLLLKSVLKIVMILNLVVLTGCVYQAKPDKSNPVKSVAVLPVVNSSNDIDEADHLQKDIAKELKGLFYQVKKTAEVNQFLRDEYMVTLGKQLVDFTPQELSKALDVDGLVYVYLFDAETVALSKNYYRYGVKFIDSAGEQKYGKGVAIKKLVASGGVSNWVNLATEVTDAFGDNTIGAVPTSDNPVKEMPGLERWIQMPSVTQTDQGLVGGLIATAVASALDSSFGEERDFGLQQVFGHHSKADKRYKFPLGPGQ